MQVLPVTWQLFKLAGPTNFISTRNDPELNVFLKTCWAPATLLSDEISTYKGSDNMNIIYDNTGETRNS